jgi:hypothetical protein
VGVDALYSVKFKVQLREFANQKSGNSMPEINIKCDNFEDFKSKAWEKIQGFVKRQIIIDGETFQFAEKETEDLNVEDLQTFLIIFDETSKRTVSIESISTSTLQGWLDKEGLHFRILFYLKLTVGYMDI